ncbi:MAG: aminotransferase class V-fold PLP-dependent enzyme [Alphaproteobacteria bacterium]|nr:aminotransferase class V-fold PLP-dependent enzyme [Alphaproteobacteria bacterium]
MTKDITLDVEFCRDHFSELAGDWVLMENAGGTLVPRQVIDRLNRYASHCQVQPGEGYPASDAAQTMIDEGRAALAALINADPDEIVVGPSTTSNVYVLSHALAPLLAPGDEIIVTNQDHEANNGAWRRLAALGVVVREWKMNRETDDLELEDLEPLLNDRTRLVCFTHCSNIVGMIHDVKAIVKRIHAAGAMACVDGVAYTPHRRVDVKDLDVDFYLYSPYKIFGPHLGVLYGKREALAKTANQNHYFVPDEGDYQRSLCPGGPNHELTAAAGGIAEYFDALHEHHFPGANLAQPERLDNMFRLIAAHETALAGRIGDYLASKPSVRVVGQGAAARRERVGVFAFLVEGRDSREIAEKLRAAGIGAFADDFYAARCIDAIGARPQNGVVRVSVVHYNSGRDVDRLVTALENIL